MSEERGSWIFVVACALMIMFGAEPTAIAQTQGPSKGWLVIVGGGGMTNEVKDRFLALAGGADATLVAIPTALGDDEIDVDKLREKYQRSFRISNVTVLHTRSRKVANSEQFAAPLKTASAVWIDGGRQWRLADAYLGTAVEQEIKAVLARGGVVGGSSAGASIQASFLVRGQPGTSHNPGGDNRIMMSPGHETGFGLLTNSAIDQHVLVRNREADLSPVIAAHPELLGIGIDQEAAIVVHGDTFFVVSGTIVIHNQGQGKHFQTLSSGESYNLARRSSEPDDSRTLGFDSLLKPTSASRRTVNGGLISIGAATLEHSDSITAGTEAIQYECDAPLYSAGQMQYPAKKEKDGSLTIRVRALNGSALSPAACRIRPNAGNMQQ